MDITTHLHVVKDSWNFKIMFNNFFNFLISYLSKCECFLSVDNQLTLAQFFLIKIHL
jgi:hypothetical protein